MILMTPTAAAAVSHRCLQLKLPFCAKEKWWLLKHACFEPPESLLMQATAGALPEDVQRLFQDVEDYLLAGLEKENLSARAREEGEAILVDIEQLKERYQWELQPRGVLPEFSSTRDASGDSLTWNVASEGSLPLGYPENRAENSCPKATQELGLVLKQGYLEKKSRDPKIFGSEWQKRWCVLTQTAFSYYANEKSKQPKGRFPIENYRARLASYLRKDARRGCCFELMCPGKRTYEFTASSPEEAKDWVDQILFLLQDMRSLVIPFEEDVKEETYDDIDSFESSHTMLLKNSSLNPEEEGETEEESREGIYEILPGLQRLRLVGRRAEQHRGDRPKGIPHAGLRGRRRMSSRSPGGPISSHRSVLLTRQICFPEASLFLLRRSCAPGDMCMFLSPHQDSYASNPLFLVPFSPFHTEMDFLNFALPLSRTSFNRHTFSFWKFALV
ncbi:src kinase-associated phosphoprotein 1 isoform X1 [Paroedura picta]|uniref:src kinase-associated phosphoprotein 1 isoform X1 n=1 Tax=Paroedura picta TaxID=143630 RepID=UPI00405786B9